MCMCVRNVDVNVWSVCMHICLCEYVCMVCVSVCVCARTLINPTGVCIQHSRGIYEMTSQWIGINKLTLVRFVEIPSISHSPG